MGGIVNVLCKQTKLPWDEQFITSTIEKNGVPGTIFPNYFHVGVASHLWHNV